MKTFSKILIIAKYTFLEVLKSRILILIALMGVALVVISYVASEFTYGVPQKVSLDFGLGFLSLSLVGISIFMGSTLISKEIENRTLYMILSRPVSREVFLIGKMVGFIELLFLAAIILGSVSIVIFLVLGGTLTTSILACISLIFMEATITMLVVILLSLITNYVAAVVYSIALYIAGFAVNELLGFVYVQSKPFLNKFLLIYSYIFPNYGKINLKEYVIYDGTIPEFYLIKAFAYGLFYNLFLFVLITFIFKNKELD